MSEEKIDLEFQKRSEACDQVEARIKEYVDEYEFDDGESSHMPTELESFLIYDAIHGLLGDDEFIAKFTAWKELCVDRQAALQESEAGAVLYMAKNLHSKSYATSRSKAEAELFLLQSGLKIDGKEAAVIPLYPAPPSAQAIETAAYMRAAEVADQYEKPGLADEIRSLIPQDGRTQLEEFGIRVASKAAGYGWSMGMEGADTMGIDLRAIVANLIGEKK